MHLTGLSHVVKMRDVHKSQQDIKTDPIIKDQMENLGCLLAFRLVIFLHMC